MDRLRTQRPQQWLQDQTRCPTSVSSGIPQTTGQSRRWRIGGGGSEGVEVEVVEVEEVKGWRWRGKGVEGGVRIDGLEFSGMADKSGGGLGRDEIVYKQFGQGAGRERRGNVPLTTDRRGQSTGSHTDARSSAADAPRTGTGTGTGSGIGIGVGIGGFGWVKQWRG